MLAPNNAMSPMVKKQVTYIKNKVSVTGYLIPLYGRTNTKVINILRFCLMITMLIFLKGPAFSCSCAENPEVLVAKKQATAVFLGKVRLEEKVNHKERNGYLYTFDVSKVWKGTIKDTVVVFTPWSGTLCGFPFDLEKEYLVYTHGEDQLRTSSCTRTAPIEKNDYAKVYELDPEEDLRVLGEPLKQYRHEK